MFLLVVIPPAASLVSAGSYPSCWKLLFLLDSLFLLVAMGYVAVTWFLLVVSSTSPVSTDHIPIDVLFDSTSGGLHEFFLASDEDAPIGMSRIAADPDSEDEVLAEILFRGQYVSGAGVVVVDKLPDDEIVDPRLALYIDTRPNGDALRKCILKGPYTPTTVIILAVPATDNSPVVPERTTVEIVLNMSPKNKVHFESEKEAIHLILTGIGDEIYSTVDTCKTAHEM
ncbi:hypothetical protein Tco_1024393 [Tanacetum coccineum]